MNVAAVLLSIGTAVLTCGSLCWLMVCLTSPKLRGTAWLSGTFASGALGAVLLLVPGYPLFSVFGADLALLLSFVLLHVAVLQLVEDQPVHLWHGGVLLGVQAVTDMLLVCGFANGRARIISISLLITLQTTVTALLLWRLARRQIRVPALFSASLLTGFALFNLLRAGAEAFVSNPRANHLLGLVAFALFIAVAVGLAFGFFWMTTSKLTGELEHMASTDPLTRLFNRRVFLRWCERELLRSHRSGVPFSLLMVDLDHFKRVNDRFGHQTGDTVLCATVERMQDSVRGIDVLCRWGGEEFAVLLPNATVEATRIVAERIRENVERIRLPDAVLSAAARGLAVADTHLTVSIGAATYRDLDDGVAAMLERADRALYDAKSAGRNRVLVSA